MYKIGVFGSATDFSSDVQKKLIALASALVKQKIMFINGACKGIPDFVAHQVHNQGLKVWGFPPYASYEEFSAGESALDMSVFNKLSYIPKNYGFLNNLQACRKYRNVTSTATCDAGIIISGRWGTLNEFTNLHDMGKVIGVLIQTGGIADKLEELYKEIDKQTEAVVIFDPDPDNLVKQVFKKLKERNYE